MILVKCCLKENVMTNRKECCEGRRKIADELRKNKESDNETNVADK